MSTARQLMPHHVMIMRVARRVKADGGRLGCGDPARLSARVHCLQLTVAPRGRSQLLAPTLRRADSGKRLQRSASGGAQL